ncbi:MAG: response regulator [Elusimicrobia bacterium]|nr:response regulator [Elusimicrobiota bacterium]
MKTDKLAGLSLFIVEDDDHFRETFIDAMSLSGVKVEGTRTGYEAIKALGKSLPGAIIIDLQLPDIHGFDLCRIIKKSERLKKVPVVFITASSQYNDPRDRAEMLLSGAAGFLAKPISMEDMRSEIGRILPAGSA